MRQYQNMKYVLHTQAVLQLDMTRQLSETQLQVAYYTHTQRERERHRERQRQRVQCILQNVLLL